MSGATREALELRFHFGERDRDGDGPLESAVMDACARGGVWAAALMRGVEGFGAKQHLRTERLLSLSEDQPLVAVAVGERERVEALAEEVRAVASEGLMTLDEVEVVGGDVAVVGSPEDGGRDVVRATIWGPRSGSESPHLRAVDALHRHGADCATVLLGVDGVLNGERQRARFVAGNRGVPAMTVAVGERGAILGALAELDASPNLVTVEGVAISSRIARTKRHGRGARVTLVTSESTQGDDHPRYLEFVHALRRGGAAGATALRGVWGFRGDVAPHGDRVLALRRDVPVIVEVVDSDERSPEWLRLAESLAAAPDLAYSQVVGRRFELD